ncbi:MAG: HAMP domain-containing sensor histidine kinase [Chryseolinea sp.]
MKLISITTRYYIIMFLIVLACWSVAFYFIMKYEVYQNTDEVLFNRATNISKHLKKNPSDINNSPLSDYQIKELTQSKYQMYPGQIYTDTLVYEPTDDEYDEYRKLQATFNLNGRYARITVVKPRMESTEIINTILFTLIPLLVLMVIILVTSARLLNKKLWLPFYKVIDFLSAYRVDNVAQLPFQKSTVDEFLQLEDSINTLISRNREVFQQQKQFIENASHETQTPLAVIQSQMEILLQLPNLSEQQSEIIQSALKETDRLNRLNRTLLFISKIENQQFLEKSPVSPYELTNRLFNYFDEKRVKFNISVELRGDAESILNTNKMMLEVMIGNLLKNAFAHNVINGSIVIDINKDSFRIENTGKPLAEPNRIFERFYYKTERTDNYGLGLSIVKKIVDINQWRITYNWLDQKHIFTIHFN